MFNIFSSQIYYKKVIPIVIIGIVFVIAESWGALYFVRKISLRAQKIQEIRMNVAVHERDKLEFAILLRDYERVREFIAKLEGAFPKTEELFGTLAEFGRLAERTGNRQTLSVEGYEPRPSDIPGVSFVSFSASLDGSYESFRGYLRELRRAPFFIQVDGFSISSSESINNESKINLSGKIFLR